MDNCKDIIEKRKSVRSFNDKEVSNEDILKILDSARLAPSAKNRQPWRFRILSEYEKEKFISIFEERLKKENSEETGFATIRILKESSKVVLVFMDYKEITNLGLSIEPYYFSMGAAIQNALLRATELGIGSLWIYDAIAIREELEEMFAEGKMFISTLCFGYEDKVLPRAKKKSLEEIILK